VKKQKIFSVELKVAHSESERLYQVRSDMSNFKMFGEIMKQDSNPFGIFDNKKFKKDGKSFGKIISSKTATPSCELSGRESLCAFWHVMQVEVPANKVKSLLDLIDLVLSMISNIHIDILKASELTPGEIGSRRTEEYMWIQGRLVHCFENLSDKEILDEKPIYQWFAERINKV